MGSDALSGRENWQTASAAIARKVEEDFVAAFQSALDSEYPGVFQVDPHPKEFDDIYSTFELPDDVLEQIYNVDLESKHKNGNLKYI